MIIRVVLVGDTAGWSNERVVGFADKPLELWVNEVAGSHQQQGLGQRALGCGQARLPRDAANPAAMRPYPLLAALPAPAVQFVSNAHYLEPHYSV